MEVITALEFSMIHLFDHPVLGRGKGPRHLGNEGGSDIGKVSDHPLAFSAQVLSTIV